MCDLIVRAQTIPVRPRMVGRQARALEIRLEARESSLGLSYGP